MQPQKSPKSLIITLLIIGILISASLVFLGIQFGTVNRPLNDDEFQTKVEAAIEVFIDKQNAAQKERRQGPKNIAKLIPPVSTETDHIYGNPNAVISLIEYSDFECPFCKKFHTTPPKIVAQYDNKVNWVYRHLPLAFHNPGAQKQAEASECANEVGGNKAFWKYADQLYLRTKSNGNGFPLTNLVPLAVELGLDENTFKSCLESGKYAKRVEKDLNDAMKMGISGTPSIVIRNNLTGAIRFKSGAYPAEVFSAEIEALLN